MRARGTTASWERKVRALAKQVDDLHRRLERRGDALEVDIFVAVEGRGRGIALAMLDAVQVKAAARWPNCDLLARVKPENWASRHLFAKAGYGKTLVESNHLVMRLVAGN